MINEEKTLKRAGIGGILLGVLACLLCALPFVFGIAGFAWLAMFEKIGLITALMGISLLLWLWLRNSHKEKST